MIPLIIKQSVLSDMGGPLCISCYFEENRVQSKRQCRYELY